MTEGSGASQQDFDNESSTQDSSQIVRVGGGVTDYFAILGIGDNLCLQSTFKKTQRISDDDAHQKRQRNGVDQGAATLDADDDTKEEETKNGDYQEIRAKEKMEWIREEEQCEMLERFYREIVEVAIFTVHSDGNGTLLEGTLATSNKNFDENDSDDGHLYNQKIPEPERISFPSSPTRSIADSAITCDVGIDKSQSITPTRVPVLNQSHDGDKAFDLPSEISGFQILYKTCSTNEQLKDSLWNQDDHASLPHDNNDLSFGQDTLDVSAINHSFSITNTSFMGTDFAGNAQVYDADLNPGMGLRGTLLSQVHSIEDSLIQQQHFQEGDSSFNLNGSIDKGIDMSFDSSFLAQETKTSKLGGLVGKRVKSILPILTASTKGGIDSRRDGGVVTRKQYYVGYRRRGADENSRPAIAELLIRYVRIHRATIIEDNNLIPVPKSDSLTEKPFDDLSFPATTRKISAQNGAAAIKRGLVTGAGIAKRMAKNSMKRSKSESVDKRNEVKAMNDNESAQIGKEYDIIHLHEVLDLPDQYDEWIVPDNFHSLRIPRISDLNKEKEEDKSVQCDTPANTITESSPNDKAFNRMQKTFLFPHQNSPTTMESGIGMEAFVDGSTFLRHSPSSKRGDKIRRNPWSPVEGPPESQEDSSKLQKEETLFSAEEASCDPDSFMPILVNEESLPGTFDPVGSGELYEYVPIIASRRQRVGEEERFREDPAIIEIGISFTGRKGDAIIPIDDSDDDDNDEDEDRSILGKTKWTTTSCRNVESYQAVEDEDALAQFGNPLFVYKRNRPLGFLDTPFAASLLDRFPKRNYEGVPLPEEELPMFCYPTGCRLHREKYQDTPLPEYYGFVVKNERGDSIYGR